MCKILTIWKESDDGERFDDLGEFDTFSFDVAGLCGCWWGQEPGAGVTQEQIDELHNWLMERLKPYLADPRWGRIIIETH